MSSEPAHVIRNSELTTQNSKTLAARRVDLRRPDVVHAIGRADAEPSGPEQAVDGDLVALGFRIGDRVGGKDAAPLEPVLRVLDALDRRVIVAYFEQHDRPAGVDAHRLYRQRRRRVVDLERRA